jgi:hypothetical protein
MICVFGQGTDEPVAMHKIAITDCGECKGDKEKDKKEKKDKKKKKKKGGFDV